MPRSSTLVFERGRVAGAWVLDLERRTDERGFFARVFCQDQFRARGLVTDFVQGSLAYTARKGTIRGLHYQTAPAQEVKLVRCSRGAIWDVIVDLRSDSGTYLQSFGVELTADGGRQLYVPEGCAHGYQTLVDGTEVTYLVSHAYAPEHERGVRWDDPLFRISWPVASNLDVSPKDRAWPDFPAAQRLYTGDSQTFGRS
jgi:dTDP-4-dehydrorhamnose 3,5-epimerase